VSEGVENRGSAPLDRPAEWGWIGELEADALTQAAKVSLELLVRGEQWVNRRVETINLIDESRVRQSVSVDFRLPERLPGSFTIAGKEHYALPLLILPRRSDLSCFDVCDESGRSLPILTRSENARLSGLMLLRCAERAAASAEGEPRELSISLRTVLAGLPKRARRSGKSIAKQIVEREESLFPEVEDAEPLLADPLFRDLLGLFQYASAIHIPLQVNRGERRIVKVSWEGRWDPPDGVPSGVRRGWHGLQGFAGWRPQNHVLDLPQLGGSESHHVQIAAPPGVVFSKVSAPNGPPRLMLPGGSGLPDPKDAQQPHSDAVSPRVHLYLPRAYEMRAGLLSVEMRSAGHGLLPAAILTGLLVTALLALYGLRAKEIIGQSDTGAAVLLLVPAVLAGFLIRPGEHAMARVLLRGPRRITTALGLLPLLAAAGLVAGPDDQPQSLLQSLFHAPETPLPGWLPTAWLVLASLAAVLTGALIVSGWFSRTRPAAPQS
jgi:hypothetical protein